MMHSLLVCVGLGIVAWLTVAPAVALMLQMSGKKPNTLAVILMAPLLITCLITDRIQSMVVRRFTKSEPERK